MGKSNSSSASSSWWPRWQSRLPHVGAAAACDAKPPPAPAHNVLPFDRMLPVLPVLQLHLAPAFASSFNRRESLNSMASYGKRGRGPFPFTVFHDEDQEEGPDVGFGREGDEGDQSQARLQKRLRRDYRREEHRQRPHEATRTKPSATFPPSSRHTSDSLSDLPQPLASRAPPSYHDERKLSRSSRGAHHTARWSGQSEPGHLGSPDELTFTLDRDSYSVSRRPRSTSPTADELIIRRLSSALEPVDAPLSRRAPATLSELLSAPASPVSPTVTHVTCHPTRHSSSGFDELSLAYHSESRPIPAHSRDNLFAEQQSISDQSTTLTNNNSSIQHAQSDLTDTTITDALSVSTHGNFILRKRQTLKNLRKMRQVDNLKSDMYPKGGDSPRPSARTGSSANLLNKFGGVLAEKSANIKRSLFKNADTSKQGEKLSIGAPYDFRQGDEALKTPPRLPNPGEDQRKWGNVEMVSTKSEAFGPRKKYGGDEGHDAQALVTKDQDIKDKQAQERRGSMEVMPCPLQVVRRDESESPIRSGFLGESSPSMTALPTRPPTVMGFRQLVQSRNRLSRLNVIDQDTSAKKEVVPVITDRPEDSTKPSIMQKMKDSFKSVRRHKRRNTTIHSAMELGMSNDKASKQCPVQENQRASRSAVLLISAPLTPIDSAEDPFRDEEHAKPEDEEASKPEEVLAQLPEIDAGGPMSFSNMNLIGRPRFSQDGAVATADAVTSSLSEVREPALGHAGSDESRPNGADADLPAFARDRHIPAGVNISGHAGFHRMNPLGSHGNVLDFASAPAKAHAPVEAPVEAPVRALPRTPRLTFAPVRNERAIDTVPRTAPVHAGGRRHGIRAGIRGTNRSTTVVGGQMCSPMGNYQISDRINAMRNKF